MVLISKEGDFEKPSTTPTPQAATAVNPEEAVGSSYPEVEANGPYPEDSFPYFNHGGWGYRGRGGRGSPFVMHGNFNHHHHHRRPETVPLDDGPIHHDHHSHVPIPPMPLAPPMPSVSHPDPPEAPLPPPPPPAPGMPYGFDFSTLGPRIAGMVGEQTANWAQAFANSFSPNSHEGGHQHHPGTPWSPRHGRGFPFGRRGGGGFGWSGPGSSGRWGPPFPPYSHSHPQPHPHPHPPPPAHFHGHWHGKHGHGHGSRLIHPNMDIFHSENTYIVTVELPGLQKSDVELGVKDGVLTISGEFPNRKDGEGDGDAGPETFDYMEDDIYDVMVDDEGEEITLADHPIARKGDQQPSTSGGAGAAEKGKYVLHERPVGKFKRSVRLPPWVDVEAIKATMSDGILTLVLEKPAPEWKDDGMRRINIL